MKTYQFCGFMWLGFMALLAASRNLQLSKLDTTAVSVLGMLFCVGFALNWLSDIKNRTP